MSKSPKMPSPSPEERELQREQTEILRQQRDILNSQLRTQELLAPFLYKQAGIKPLFEEVDREALTGRLNELGAEYDERLAAAKEQGIVDPRLNELSNEIQSIQGKLAGRDLDITGFEELEDPNQALRDEIETAFLERSRSALKGELPLNPALIRDLETQESELRETLRKQLGPGFETSTAGIEALANFGKRRNELFDASRRGDLTLAESLGLAREGANQGRIDDFMNRTSGVAGQPSRLASMFTPVAAGFGNAAAGLRQDRFARAQLAAQSGSNMNELFGSLFGSAARLGSAWLFS